MYLGALADTAAQYVSRQAYEAPVYRNVLDVLASVEHMGDQVFAATVAGLLTGNSANSQGYAINRTGWQDKRAGYYLVFTSLLDWSSKLARDRVTVQKYPVKNAYRKQQQEKYAAKSGGISTVRRLREAIADLQDEIEFLVRELNRVRLPLPKDLRYWARQMERNIRDLPLRYRVLGLNPRTVDTGLGLRRYWVQIYEIAYQAHELKQWIPTMRLKIYKEIAKANLLGKIGTIDLEIEPSMRAIEAARDRESALAISEKQAKLIEAEYDRRQRAAEAARKRRQAAEAKAREAAVAAQKAKDDAAREAAQRDAIAAEKADAAAEKKAFAAEQAKREAAAAKLAEQQQAERAGKGGGSGNSAGAGANVPSYVTGTQRYFASGRDGGVRNDVADTSLPPWLVPAGALTAALLLMQAR